MAKGRQTPTAYSRLWSLQVAVAGGLIVQWWGKEGLLLECPSRYLPTCCSRSWFLILLEKPKSQTVHSKRASLLPVDRAAFIVLLVPKFHTNLVPVDSVASVVSLLPKFHINLSINKKCTPKFHTNLSINKKWSWHFELDYPFLFFMEALGKNFLFHAQSTHLRNV